MSVDLPGARRADEEHEVAFGDDEVDVAQRDLAVRVLLRDVVQHEDRAIGDGLVAASFEDATAKRARRRRRWGDGHGRLRGREGVAIGRRHGWLRFDPVRGHGSGNHVGPRLPSALRVGKRDRRATGHPDDGPVRSHQARWRAV